MIDTQSATYFTIVALIAFGIYRKNYATTNSIESTRSATGEAYLLSNPRVTDAQEPKLGKAAQRSSYVTGKHHVAKIAYQLEQKLDPNESIIQVHDYFNEPGGSGIKHTFDITLFNRVTTAALTKRIECIEQGSSVEIVNAQVMSPITGSIMTQKDIMDDVSDLLLDDNMESDTDAKFVRDKYAFVNKDVLPPEPAPLSKECTRQLNNGQLTSRCQTQLNIYTRSVAEYKKQVSETREKGTFTRRRLGFAPMNEKIEEHQKYPFSQPQTYGFAAHEDAPIDYSSLSVLKPLKDENFFNAIAMENSSIAIQYG